MTWIWTLHRAHNKLKSPIEEDNIWARVKLVVIQCECSQLEQLPPLMFFCDFSFYAPQIGESLTRTNLYALFINLSARNWHFATTGGILCVFL